MKTSLPCLILVLCLLTTLTPTAAALAISGEINYTALDDFISSQMSKHGLPGVAIAVIEDDKIAYLNSYGVDGADRSMTAQTQMLIGSQSKSFTALAIAQLAEQGQLNLNDPVQAYIPEFKVADESASVQITINHLLHHTSGLSDSGFGVIIPLDATSEQVVLKLAQARLTAPVGFSHQYFNVGYSVLAYIVELVSGQTYTEYIDEHILIPLDMGSSTADPFHAADLAPGFTRLFGFPVRMREGIPAYGVGEGFIVSTAEDMARYAIAFQTDGAGLVSPEMLKLILTPGIGSYGMGWYILDGGAKIVHGGANQTYHTEVNLYPRLNRAFVLLTNQGYQVDHFVSAGQLTAGVEAIILGRTPQQVSLGGSVQQIGWILGVFVLALSALHTRNFISLRGWKERSRLWTLKKRAWDVAISFLIPTLILTIVFWQVSSFYGNRFNFWTSLAYMRLGLPDIFILMLVGSLPDYIQGFIKIFLWQRN